MIRNIIPALLAVPYLTAIGVTAGYRLMGNFEPIGGNSPFMQDFLIVTSILMCFAGVGVYILERVLK